MNIFNFHSKIFTRLRPFLILMGYGITGLLLAIYVADVAVNYSSFFLIVFIMVFFGIHILWFQKIIQSLRINLKEPENASIRTPPSAKSFLSQEVNKSQDTLVEATFFQHLSDQLIIDNPPHIQAQCVQDNKVYLVQTSGILPLLKNNQLEILTQPIVSLPQKRLSFFSCVPCVTVENGMIINLNTIEAQPHHSVGLQAIQKMILLQTLQFIRHHHPSYPFRAFICSLLPTVVNDHQGFEEMVDFLRKTHFPFHELIFEVPLDIPMSLVDQLSQMKNLGVRFIGKKKNEEILQSLNEPLVSAVDFVMLSFNQLLDWREKQTRRQSLDSLQKILEAFPQTIISNVDKEQDLYHYLPIPFDFGTGNAFGLPKPLYQIQGP